MNNHVTCDQVAARLDENDLEYHLFDLSDGIPVIVSRRGGRILGPFAGNNRESILWLTGSFANGKAFTAFLESDDWNLGGDRVWIAPEHRYNMRDRHDLFGTYALPPQVDPGQYRLEASESGCMLSQAMTLPVYGPPVPDKRLRIERRITPAPNPLRESGDFAELASRVTYAGYLHEVRLSEDAADGVLAELWDIAQLCPGGTAYVTVSGGETHTDFYEPADPQHHQVFPHYTRLTIDGTRMFKVGYKASRFVGRVAYHNVLDRQNDYLFIRALFSNPSATYSMEPPSIPGDRGYPIQVFNDDGMYGGFGEFECSGQAIGGDTGRSAGVDQILNWFFVGPVDALAKIARILLDVELR